MSATRAACPAPLLTGLAQMSGKPARAMTAADPVYLAQFVGLLNKPGWTTGFPLLEVRLAPPTMLLIARAATSMLSIELNGSYGWCRSSDQATSPPSAPVMGSRPFRPDFGSAKLGLFPLVISANTQSTCDVPFPQAKLTWLGSDATFGFWQAVVISLCTTDTLAGHDAPFLNTIIDSTIASTTPMVTPIVILRARTSRALAPRRPWAIRTWVRSSTKRPWPGEPGEPGRARWPDRFVGRGIVGAERQSSSGS